MWNVPNCLSLFRIFLVPLLVVILLTRFPQKEWFGLAVFLTACFTDFLDGYIARRYNQISNLGKLLDPVADKLLISAAFISLVDIKVVPAWMVVVIIGREFAVTGLRNIAIQQNLTIPASALGKFKMGSQVVAIALLIIQKKLNTFAIISQIALWVVLVAAMGSMIDYFIKFAKLFKEKHV